MPAIRRVGIIGAGRTSSAHIRALRYMPGVEITGILDSDPKSAQDVATRFGIPCHFSSPKQFYDDAEPQIVHIVTPPHTHEQIAAEALDRRVHVLVEKPPSLSVEGCDALQKKAKENGLTAGVNENFSFDPCVLSVRSAIARGELGTVVDISGFFGFDASSVKADLGNWTWVRELPGGILEDLLPHPLTVARVLADDDFQLIHSYVFRSNRLPFPLDDEARLLFIGDSGITVRLDLSLSAHPADFVVTVTGTRSTIRLDLKNRLFQLWRDRHGPKLFARGLRVSGSALHVLAQTTRNAIGAAVFGIPRTGDPVRLIRAHYEALEQGTEVPAPMSRARHVVQIAREIWP